MNISIKHTEPATFKPIENDLITIKYNSPIKAQPA